MSTHPPQRHLVLAVGSPFGDDQAGWLVIEQMRQMMLPLQLQLLYMDRPGPALIEQMQGYASVTLIDAIQTDQYPPGCWLKPNLRQLAQHGSSSSHGFGLSETLALAQQLDQLPPKLRLLGISIRRTVVGEGVSEAVTAAAQALAQRLAHEYQTAIGSGGVGSLGSSSSSSS